MPLTGRDREILEAALSRVLEISQDSGTATGGSNNTVEDTGKNWGTDMWDGATIHIIHDGVEYVRDWQSNTSDTITIAPLPSGVSVEAGDSYAIRRPLRVTNIARWGGTELTGRDISGDLAHLNVDLGTLLQTADLQLDADGALNIILKTDNIGLLKTADQPLDVSGATVPTEQQTPVGIEDTGGTQVDPATEGSLTSEQPRKVSSHTQADVTIHASGAETADGNSGDIDLQGYYAAEICLDVTDVSGTSPSMDVYIEGKDPESGKYKVIDSHTGITATGTFWTTITDLIFRYIRARWVISGTSPSFTFSIGASCKA